MLVILGSAVPRPPSMWAGGEERDRKPRQHEQTAGPAPSHEPFYCCSGPSQPSLYTRQAPQDLSTPSTRAARMGDGLGGVERKRIRGWICFLSPRHGPVGVCCWQPSFCRRAGNPEQGRAVQGAALQHKAVQPRRERGEKSLLPLCRGSSRSSCTFWTRALNASNRRPDLFGTSFLLVPGSCFTPAFPETSSQPRHRGFCSAASPRAKPHEPESRRRAAQWAGRAGGQADGRLPAAARTRRKMLRRQESASPSKDSPRSRSEGMHFSTGS